MDRMVKTVIGGRECWLNYSVEVMFDMAEKYGTIQKALELMEQDNREAFDTMRWFAVRMANDGELCRREQGYDASPMLEEKAVSLRMDPMEYVRLKGDVWKAIVRGYHREVEDKNRAVDFGLQELEAKKAEAGA